MSRVKRNQLAKAAFSNRLKSGLRRNPYIASVRKNAEKTLETYIAAVKTELETYKTAVTLLKIDGKDKADDYKNEITDYQANIETPFTALKTQVDAADLVFKSFETMTVSKT